MYSVHIPPHRLQIQPLARFSNSSADSFNTGDMFSRPARCGRRRLVQQGV